MIATGTFLEMSIKTIDAASIPVILGKTSRRYFICLPDHEAAFGIENPEDVYKNHFINYMDGTSAELVATTVRRAIELLIYCGGSAD